MEKLTLQQVNLKSDELKKEIIKRLKCEIKGFEIVQYESGNIGIHWYACYHGNSLCIEIPYGWIVATIDWSEKWLHMYAESDSFMTFNS